VGLYDGTVAMYDVKTKQGSPSMMSDATTGRHADPVWKVRGGEGLEADEALEEVILQEHTLASPAQTSSICIPVPAVCACACVQVKWLDRGHERDELLVSISTDGRITQWSIAKGLECNDLMKLKRVQRRPAPAPIGGGAGGGGGGAAPTSGTGKHGAGGGGGGAGGVAVEHDAFISRLTSGMSFDFSGRDERIYIAGTEDGWIHRCSTSYSEQYLDSYQGHMGPVYNVQWSPFKKDMFISASGDWTLRLWQEDQQSALLLFQSSNTEVNDVQWCPSNATVFGNVTSGGRLEVREKEHL
jgi:WD40 repeat protein